MNRVFTLCFVLFLPILLYSQAKTQNINGKVIDAESQQVLYGVNVYVDGTPPLATQSDTNGNFTLENVPVGKINLQASYLGYSTFQTGFFQLSTGKEPYLTISLTQKVTEMKEAVITSAKSNRPNNESFAVSARSFTIAETNRFAGSINDPGRVALNYAGVMTAQDNDNDVVVRGNSPVGVLWRLEGIDVPNVNHFSRPGSSGGGISALSPFLMGGTDFSTGAFPAEYGNALSGVFDFKYRPGSFERHEFTFRLGLIGLNFGAEGPMNKKKNTSYLFNYRYSTLGLLNQVGIYVVGPNTTNIFQDFAFNFTVKNSAKTKVNIFSLGGISSEITAAKKDTAKWQKYTDKYQTNLYSNLAVLGISWTQQLNKKSFLKTVVAGTYNDVKDYDDTLGNDVKFGNIYYTHFTTTRAAANLSYNYKFSSKWSFKTGIAGDAIFYKFNETKLLDSISYNQTLLNSTGVTSTIQPYFQAKFRPMQSATLIAGIHATYLALNNSYSIEPRFSYQQWLGKGHTISIAYGLHSLVMPIGNYLTQFTDASNQIYFPNKNLKMPKSHHIVGSYSYSFLGTFRLKTEVYGQFQYDLPISKTAGSTYFLFNNRKGYAQDSLYSKGKGINYGMDVSLEKIYDKNWFMLFNATVFKSNYTLPDGRTFSTAYDNTFGLTLMGGYQYNFKKNNSLEMTIRLQYSGGFRYTPIDAAASIAANQQIEIQSQAYTQKIKDYFRPDLRIAYRENKKKYSWLLSLDLANFVDYKNVLRLFYDKDTNGIGYKYMVGILPVLAFEIDFYAMKKQKK